MTFATAKIELLALAGSRTCCLSYSELVTADGVTHVDINMRVGEEFATLHHTYESALAELRVRLGAGVQDQQPQGEPQVLCDHAGKGECASSCTHQKPHTANVDCANSAACMVFAHVQCVLCADKGGVK